ncbi:DUF421 domain-containing protein (plasmid) [Paenibacillus cellulosilyticus]|uniref:DUF421 domain-containing protein n=1 Tax=Paenibacillus cellulosilyticus TaxID=375489 RepID=UPI000D713722|nr:DUF421 domain-containing protein [Paenibacillus cellulosilyticus]QKS47644.1 DUF421 domain-containing protein [Paenibacillus cellulosilyticus]
MPLWAEVTLRTLSAVCILFVMTKILGKRQISQLSLFEYITGISIGNIAAYISLDTDNDWYLGLLAMSVWVIVSVGMEFATLKSKWVRDIVDGKGTVLVEKGAILEKNMAKERVTLDEFMEKMRSKSIHALADVEFAVMESNGDITFLLKKEQQPLTAKSLGWAVQPEREPQSIVMDGIIINDALRRAGFDEVWLRKQLAAKGVQLEEVYLAQVDDAGVITIQTGERSIP